MVWDHVNTLLIGRQMALLRRPQPLQKAPSVNCTTSLLVSEHDSLLKDKKLFIQGMFDDREAIKGRR